MRFLYALILLLFTEAAQAQLQVNDLSSLLKFADEHAPTAQRAKLQPQIAQKDIRLQSSTLYPKINVFGTGDYYPLIPTQVIPAELLKGAPGTYYKAQFGLPYIFTAGAEISMPVINLEKWATLAKTKAQYTQAQWDSKAQLEDFHIKLITAYYQTLVTKEVIKLNDENATTTNELMRIMDARNQNGVLNPSDYNRTKNLQLDVQSTGVNYTQTLKQNASNLSALLNIKDSLLLDETLTSFTWPLLQTEGAPANRAVWQEADTKVHVAELALSESKRGALPKLSLNGRYTYNYESKFEQAGNYVAFDASNIGLRLDFPVFQGNYYHTLKQKSDLQLKSAKLEQEQTHATLTQQQRDWFDLYKTAFNKKTILEERVKTTSDNLRIAKLDVKEGVMEFDEFNNIFAEYNRAKMEYLQNLADGILYYLLSTQNF